MAYTTQFGLDQNVVNYLNEAYPNLGGMFPNTTTTIGGTTGTGATATPTGAEILKDTFLAQSGTGGDGYSVYNPDPNKVRGPILQEEYMGADYYPEPPTGLKSLINQIADSSLWAKMAGAVGKMMPVSPRGIMERAAREQGFSLDDIGRIVSGGGPSDDPMNIMAGYNMWKIDDETFDKRIRNLTQSGQFDKIDQINKARAAWKEAKRLGDIRTTAAQDLKAKQKAPKKTYVHEAKPPDRSRSDRPGGSASYGSTFHGARGGIVELWRR
jgi:hypothetical protein